MDKQLYLCDFRKNKSCKKHTCAWNFEPNAGFCYLTTNVKCSLLADGRDPIKQDAIGPASYDDDEV